MIRIKPYECVPRARWIQWGIIEHGEFPDEEEFFLDVWLPSYGYEYQIYSNRYEWCQRGFVWLGKRGFMSIMRPAHSGGV